MSKQKDINTDILVNSGISAAYYPPNQIYNNVPKRGFQDFSKVVDDQIYPMHQQNMYSYTPTVLQNSDIYQASGFGFPPLKQEENPIYRYNVDWGRSPDWQSVQGPQFQGAYGSKSELFQVNQGVDDRVTNMLIDNAIRSGKTDPEEIKNYVQLNRTLFTESPDKLKQTVQNLIRQIPYEAEARVKRGSPPLVLSPELYEREKKLYDRDLRIHEEKVRESNKNPLPQIPPPKLPIGGSGISHITFPEHKKWLIDRQKLEGGVVSIKYNSGRKVPGMKNLKASLPYIELLKGGDPANMTKITDEEKTHYNKLRGNKSKIERGDLNQLEIYIGECKVGNHPNVELGNKLTKLISKMKKDKILTKEQHDHIFNTYVTKLI